MHSAAAPEVRARIPDHATGDRLDLIQSCVEQALVRAVVADRIKCAQSAVEHARPAQRLRLPRELSQLPVRADRLQRPAYSTVSHERQARQAGRAFRGNQRLLPLRRRSGRPLTTCRGARAHGGPALRPATCAVRSCCRVNLCSRDKHGGTGYAAAISSRSALARRVNSGLPSGSRPASSRHAFASRSSPFISRA